MDSSRRVSFTALLVRALRHSADFSGRSTRAELVVTFIAAILFGSLTSLAFMLFGWPSSSHSVLALNLISILPFPALLARRMHDQGRSGWFILPAAYSFTLWLWRSVTAVMQGVDARVALDRATWPLDWIGIAANIAMIALLVLPGERRPNRFGADPRGHKTPLNPRSEYDPPAASPSA